MGAGGDFLAKCGKRPEYEPFDILSEVQGTDGEGEGNGGRKKKAVTNSRLFETVVL